MTQSGELCSHQMSHWWSGMIFKNSSIKNKERIFWNYDIQSKNTFCNYWNDSQWLQFYWRINVILYVTLNVSMQCHSILLNGSSVNQCYNQLNPATAYLPVPCFDNFLDLLLQWHFVSASETNTCSFSKACGTISKNWRTSCKFNNIGRILTEFNVILNRAHWIQCFTDYEIPLISFIMV